LTFVYKNLTPKHAANIYVSSVITSLAECFVDRLFQVTYKVSTLAHLKKPVAVAVGFLSLFGITMLVKRIEWAIHSKKKTQ